MIELVTYTGERIDEDVRFFQQHPDRFARIRLPKKVLMKNQQLAVRYVDECEGEFWSLGEHDRKRRRIILTRADFEGNPLPDNRVLKIPFLAFADEEIADRDDVLLPLARQIMQDALEREAKR